MGKWEQEKQIKWPSRTPVWTVLSFFLGAAVFVGVFAWQYAREWTPLQRYYLRAYVQTWRKYPPLAKDYAVLKLVNRQGQRVFALNGAFRALTPEKDGSLRYVLADAIVARGWIRAELDAATDDASVTASDLHVYLRKWIYKDRTIKEEARHPGDAALGAWAVFFCFGLWRDGRNAAVRKNGQRVRGAEMVTIAQFNRRNKSDGVGWINADQSWLDRQFNRDRWLRIPRAAESSHILLMADTGGGKSAAIRQLLVQIEERGETAIVYDPATEYLPEFYEPERGDVILNPLDARSPYWTPGKEVTHPAEALTLATSLFQDEDKQHEFFVKWSREIFAHLINLKPTPEQLVQWMSHPEEIDRLVKGTPLAASINPQSANQRNGVLGSLNKVASTLQLLPAEHEVVGTWSAADWSKERKGWIFITSRPTFRDQLRPLISLWLDMLVLQLMNDGASGARKTWFVLDELASLQRLPQLHTALTENRKTGNPVVLGFQGRSQLEKRYGLDAESMLSQPATKIFLKTSEANAAEWISKTLGDEERAYVRETKTDSQQPAQSRSSISEQTEMRIKRLVMASQISGLASLHGYVKLGNLVVPLHFIYPKFPERHPGFVPRKFTPPINSEPAMGGSDVPLPPPADPQASQDYFFE